MKKTNNILFVVVGIVVLLLLIIYVSRSPITKEKWKEGIYPIHNDMVIHTNDQKITTVMGFYVVGDEIKDMLANSKATIKLVGDNEVAQLDYQRYFIDEYEHYFEVALYINLQLTAGTHRFTDIDIEFPGNESYNCITNIGDIVFEVFEQKDDGLIKGELHGFRRDGTGDFLYTVINNSEKDIEIVDIQGLNSKNYEDIITVLDPVELGSESVDLLGVKNYSYPVILPAQKQIWFVLSIPLSGIDKFTSIYFKPSVLYKSMEDSTISRLCLYDGSRMPLPKLKADEVRVYVK